MTENKTQATAADVAAFLEIVKPPQRREDAKALIDLFRRVTGCAPRMWGPSIIGFGEYHYKYDSGREGDFLATGFSPRKAALSIYVMPGYQDYSEILSRLGKHSIGKACLYVKKLSDIDTGVLEELIRAGLADLARKYPVKLA
ncbi:MAG: DUF1801 domain-containing protein [Maricaulaceae bacterium]|nr:DUF1801 domain-containing protein [Maricaulaceae bacterium]